MKERSSPITGRGEVTDYNHINFPLLDILNSEAAFILCAIDVETMAIRSIEKHRYPKIIFQIFTAWYKWLGHMIMLGENSVTQSKINVPSCDI